MADLGKNQTICTLLCCCLSYWFSSSNDSSFPERCCFQLLCFPAQTVTMVTLAPLLVWFAAILGNLNSCDHFFLLFTDLIFASLEQKSIAFFFFLSLLTLKYFNRSISSSWLNSIKWESYHPFIVVFTNYTEYIFMRTSWSLDVLEGGREERSHLFHLKKVEVVVNIFVFENCIWISVSLFTCKN